MTELMLQSISGLDNFALYFLVALVDLILFKYAYSAITPHAEWTLIKENNASASIAFSGAIIGYAIALGSAASNSQSLIDFTIWAFVALIAQIFAFFLARFVLSDLVNKIKEDQVASGIMVASVSIAIGLLNAACMTY